MTTVIWFCFSGRIKQDARIQDTIGLFIATVAVCHFANLYRNNLTSAKKIEGKRILAIVHFLRVLMCWAWALWVSNFTCKSPSHCTLLLLLLLLFLFIFLSHDCFQKIVFISACNFHLFVPSVLNSIPRDRRGGIIRICF